MVGHWLGLVLIRSDSFGVVLIQLVLTAWWFQRSCRTGVIPAMPLDDVGAKLWMSGASDVNLSVASSTKQVW